MEPAAVHVPTKLSKSQRKLAKKQAKACHALLKHDGIHTVTNPTSILLVANGGLGNGIQRSEIHNVFTSVGPVEDVVMLRGKPYCFVKYGNTSLATSAMHALQGYCLREGDGPANVTLYLSFVESVPAEKPQPNEPPPGLIIIPDFIDEGLEGELIQSIDFESSSPTANQSLKHRKVKHYGYEFNYSTNNVDRDTPLPGGMPELYGQVIDRIMETGHVQFRPDQLTINQYQPGQGIPPHVDTHSAFEDAIIALSLESQIVMEFTHPEGHQLPVVLPRRSLVIMTAEARYKWTHGITPKKTDIIPDPSSPDNLTLHQRGRRTSFTFRALRGGPCNCNYPERCDSQKSKVVAPSPPPKVVYPKSEQDAARLEAEQVHVVYNNIAHHFSGTRYKPWPKVVDFLNGLEPGSVVLDVGCGNGKYLGVNKGLYMIGCDRSNQLIDICRARSLEGLVCDSLALPFGDGRLNACICIAVVHHMSTRNRRLQALEEISRVLRPGGLALITVWAMEQERLKEKSKYISKRNVASGGNSKASAGDEFAEEYSGSLECQQKHKEPEEDRKGRSKYISKKTETPVSHLTVSSGSDSSSDCRVNTGNGIRKFSNSNSGKDSKMVDCFDDTCQWKCEEPGENVNERIECTPHRESPQKSQCIHSPDRTSQNADVDEVAHQGSDSGQKDSDSSSICAGNVSSNENGGSSGKIDDGCDGRVMHDGIGGSSGISDGNGGSCGMRNVTVGNTLIENASNTCSSGEHSSPSEGDQAEKLGISTETAFEHSQITASSRKQDCSAGETGSNLDASAGNLLGETILIHKNRTQFEQQDLLVPWHLRNKTTKDESSPKDHPKSKDKDEIFYRYYHVFVEGEMEELCQTIPGVKVRETYYDQGNWCIIFQKLS